MASWASRSESERENFVWWLRSTLSEERIWTIQLLESRATTRRYSGRAVRGSPLCRTASLEVVGIVEPSKINQWAKIAGELRARGGSVVRVAVAARRAGSARGVSLNDACTRCGHRGLCAGLSWSILTSMLPPKPTFWDSGEQ